MAGNPESVDPLSWVREELARLAAANLIRHPVEVSSEQGPTIRVGGSSASPAPDRELINFASNNYLNLAGDPRIRAAAADAVARWGFGSGSSRLISGTTTAHRRAERDLAEFFATEDAILLATGYQTNVAAIAALAGVGDAVILDKLDHASLIDGVRQSGARLRAVPHGDVGRLAALAERERGSARRVFVVTDSLFSMDGDAAPLGELVELRRRLGFTLIVDEAHAIGVLGATGRGVAESLGVADQVDVLTGTCSKSLGGAGGFIAGRRVLIDYLRNVARPFIFSTAPPAAAAAVASAALRIIRDEPWRRQRLRQLAGRLRAKLGLPGDGHIVPVILGDEQRALDAQRSLLERGMLVAAIRPPTVPRGTSRLRISLMCDHTAEQIDRLAEALRDFAVSPMKRVRG